MRNQKYHKFLGVYKVKNRCVHGPNCLIKDTIYSIRIIDVGIGFAD